MSKISFRVSKRLFSIRLMENLHAQQAYNSKQHPLFVPSLQELASAMKMSLRKNFKKVNVSVERCIDLTEIGCASKGLGGKPCLADIGGVPFLLDPEWQDVYFDLTKILKAVEKPKGSVIGAAAAWNGRIGVNGELMPTACLTTNQNNSYFSLVNEDGNSHCSPYLWHEQGPLSNMFISDGETTNVVCLEVEVRTGDQNLITCLRKGLTDYFQCEGEKQIGLGGVFLVEKGKVHSHVMSDFLPTCLNDGSPEVVNEWLKYFEVGPNLLCLSTLVTGDPTEGDMHLRLEHTHFFSREQPLTGGHYHFDTTPDTVKYIGYFQPAEQIFRIRDAWDEVILPFSD